MDRDIHIGYKQEIVDLMHFITLVITDMVL